MLASQGISFLFGRIHCDRTPPQIRAARTRWLRSVGSAHGVSNVSDLQTLRTAVQQQKTQNGVDIARVEMSHAEGTIRLICCRPPFGCQRPTTGQGRARGFVTGMLAICLSASLQGRTLGPCMQHPVRPHPPPTPTRQCRLSQMSPAGETDQTCIFRGAFARY